jgi:uncharacterized coiled-coil protein SlyX
VSEQRTLHRLLDELHACEVQLAHQANVISALADQLALPLDERTVLQELRAALEAIDR